MEKITAAKVFNVEAPRANLIKNLHAFCKLDHIIIAQFLLLESGQIRQRVNLLRNFFIDVVPGVNLIKLLRED
jgi:hypothetical protein